MIKIVIVEDEYMIRKGLVNTVDWLSMDCIIIGEAANGEDGLRLILELRPDLVITDIKMPLINGIDMLQKINNEYDFEKIILTSYSEFEYAKKAIDLRVFDYLLKPIDEDKLKKIIQRVKEKIEERNILKQFKSAIKDYKNIELVNIEFYLKSDNNKSKYTQESIKYIKENYSKKASIEEISEKLAVSTSYLSRKFKDETTYTFHDFLNRFRIQKSIDLLIRGEYKVYEVSYMSGFTDYKHYATVFKKYINSSPLEFIKANSYIKEENRTNEKQ
jgi:two-component system response regulator YesN